MQYQVAKYGLSILFLLPGMAANCSKTSTLLPPLTAPFFTNYKGSSGGLYPNGSNERPAGQEAGGRTQMASVQPRDAFGGVNSPTGKIGLLSLGMLNASEEFSAFTALAAADTQVNPKVVIVDGAQDGVSADSISANPTPYFNAVEQRLTAAALSDAQVQVAWIELADASSAQPFPDDANKLQAELKTVVQFARSRFPNLKLVYLSSRIYAGYAATGLQEPYTYETGYAVKSLIEAQINGDASLNYASGNFPWLAWGPYIWNDGTSLRIDGLTYACSDFLDDGSQPSAAGRAKVARMLLDFFKADTTTRPWFVGTPAQTPAAPVPTSILNAAGFFGTIAPGGIASVFGTNLASDTATAPGLPLPYGLAGTSIDVGGQPAPIYFVSPGQINFVVPPAFNGASITITREGNVSTITTAQFALNTEGLFHLGSATAAAALHADGTLISIQAPAARGETIELFGTGIGIRNPMILAPQVLPNVTVGGAAATVQYFGPQLVYPGMDQINITIPSDAPTGAAVPVIVFFQSVSSNAVTIAIQ